MIPDKLPPRRPVHNDPQTELLPPAPVREVPALERAGRAMCRNSGVWPDARMKIGGGSTDIECIAWQHYAAQFAVGLLAIREPTAGMKGAMERELEGQLGRGHNTDGLAVGQAMVDEVLK